MHPTELQLNDYIDGLLDTGETAELERHLAACAACRREVAELRAIVARVSAVPAAIQPERDLRAEIWERVDRRGPLWTVRYQLAAAAIVLIALSSLLTLAVVKSTSTPDVAVTQNDVRLVSRDAQTLQREYSEEVRELEMVLRKSRGALAPATVRILQENLAIIDKAIREAQSALAADPNSEMLIDLLRSAYERKLELLRQAAKSSPVTT